MTKDKDEEILVQLPPMHPGEVLREDFLEARGLTPYALAKEIGVPRTRIERIAREELGISAHTALLLAARFGTSAEFWLNLQRDYEVELAQIEIGEQADAIAERFRKAS